MESVFLKACAVMIAVASIPVTGKQALGPGAFVAKFFGIIENEQEMYVYSQIALEQIAEAVELYDQPRSERISEKKKLYDNATVQELIEICDEYRIQLECSNSLYRTYNGTCNNINHPLWGSSNYMMNRLLPASYDGISDLRKSVSGGDLPNARNVSLQLLDEDIPSKDVSAMFTFFGQIIAHDISLAPAMTRNGQTIPCCDPSERNNTACINIIISKDDPFYKQFNFTCFQFTRTAPYPKGNFEKRSPINKETSFIDASPIYGYNETIASRLRTNNGSGKLQSQNSVYGDLLPANHIPNIAFCPIHQTTTCFASGDERVNQHATLTSVQTVLMRFHNKIADELHAMNPNWGEEKLFQEIRRIVIAIFQHIIYTEYLPYLVGPKLMKTYKLSVDENSFYNDNVNPGVLVEFATGSFRLHSMIPKNISKYNPHLRFDETYSRPELLHNGETESLVAGSCEVSSQKNDRYIQEDVVGFLYRPPPADFGTDLTAADVQRGRDHGMPPYVDIVRKCSNGNINIRKFSHLNQIMPEANVKLLQSIYKNVLDIDLIIGIYLENLAEHSVTGYTAACLSAEQFYRQKYGDSFFFTHKNGRYPFTDEQLKSIRNFSLAHLICQAGGFSSIRRYPLLMPSDTNYKRNCSSMAQLDVTPWKDS